MKTREDEKMSFYTFLRDVRSHNREFDEGNVSDNATNQCFDWLNEEK